MASSSVNSANLLGKKRKPEDDLETKPVLRKHKDNKTFMSLEDIVLERRFGFIEDFELRKKTLCAGFFSPYTQISDIVDFYKDAGQVVRVRRILKRRGLPVGHYFLEFASADDAMKALQNKNRECLQGHKILLTKVLDDKTEEALVSTRTLFVANFSLRAQISDIIDFFKDVGKVVRVLLIAGHYGHHLGYGFVEFASANEAMNALQTKNHEFLHHRTIYLETAPDRPQLPKFCIDHKVCYEEDFFQPIKQDETPCCFAEEVVLVANLSPQITKIKHIIDVFETFGEIVGVRLIVNDECKHVGYCFVEFASAKEAEKALEENGEYFEDHKIFLRKGVVKAPNLDEVDAVREKTLHVTNLPRLITISKIIDFFKDVGEVVHVRHMKCQEDGKHWSYMYVEFASADEANKALERKNGEYLHGSNIILSVPKRAANPRHPKYEDYLVRKSLVIEEDETPEEVEVRKRTLFVTNIPAITNMTDINRIFNSVGDLVRMRVIVDDRGWHLGCGFFEFSSAEEANQAKKALHKMVNFNVYVNLAEKAFQPKYNLEEKLWYEDSIRRESLDYKTTRNLENQMGISLGFRGKKTSFSDHEEEDAL